MPKSATPIFLSNDDKSYLKSILQKGTVEARVHRRAKILLMNYPAASCGVSKVATSTNNPICYTALFSLRFYRLFYNFFPVPVLSHIYL